MLPVDIRPFNFGSFEREEWEAYRSRLVLPEDEAILQFYRQVVYDHFDHFNDHYPDFELSDYDFEIKILSAVEARDTIRFFRGDTLDSWGFQFDEFERRNHVYIIYHEMSKNKTFPFPPIIIEPSKLQGKDWRECGRPLHLIEGTHRVSYLRRMLTRGLIEANSLHRFVLLTPK